ncbi:hypothetical protein [Psittacicella melopsittaci]|nr:hypothetical protein [Psittacicella melopsittaci]
MSANHLINLADELATGKITLEDLFYDQLVADVLTLKDMDQDVEKDPDFYVDTPADLQKFANFDFTKSVMSEIANLEVAEDEEFYEVEDDIDSPVAIELEDVKQTPYANLGNNNGIAFFSEKHEEPSNPEYQPRPATSATSVKTETSIFNLRNIFGAAFAFIATFACIGLFNKFINNNGSFSTLAYSDPALTKALDSNNSGLLVNNFANTSVASNYSFKAYEVNDPVFKNYQPQLLTNVQLVSLHLIQPTQKMEGLLLSDKQTINLSTFVTNYEIQKRLSPNK